MSKPKIETIGSFYNYGKKVLRGMKINDWIRTILLFAIFIQFIRYNDIVSHKTPSVFLLSDAKSMPFVYHTDTKAIKNLYEMNKDELLFSFSNIFTFFYCNMIGDNAWIFYDKAKFFFYKDYYNKQIKTLWLEPGNQLITATKIKSISNSITLDFKILNKNSPYQIWILILQTLDPFSQNETFRLHELVLDVFQDEVKEFNPFGLYIINMRHNAKILDKAMYQELYSKYPTKMKPML